MRYTLRQCREWLELTQEGLALEIGVTRATVVAWENGYWKRHVDDLRKLVCWLTTALQERRKLAPGEFIGLDNFSLDSRGENGQAHVDLQDGEVA